MVVLSQFPVQRTVTECGFVEVRPTENEFVGSAIEWFPCRLREPRGRLEAGLTQPSDHTMASQALFNVQHKGFFGLRDLPPVTGARARNIFPSHYGFQVEEDVGCLCDCPVQAEDCHQDQFYEPGSCRCLCRDQVRISSESSLSK